MMSINPDIVLTDLKEQW